MSCWFLVDYNRLEAQDKCDGLKFFSFVKGESDGLLGFAF